MKLYADLPLRRLSQLLGDLVVLALVYLSIQVGQAAHEAVSALAQPGMEAEQQARRLDGALSDAARDVRETPLVGEELGRPFRALASTSRDLASTAQDYQDTVADVAALTGLVVALVPIAVLLIVWLPRRLRWVVDASAAVRLLRDSPGANELLAVRAIARLSLPSLVRLGPGVVEGWKAGDPYATEALARLEAAELGLRLPRARPR